MKIRMIVAATSAALFSLGAIAAGDDKQKQSQGQQPGAQQSQSATGASGSATGASGSMSTSGQSSGSAAGGASASQQSQTQAQGGAQSSDLVKQVQQKLSQEGHQLQADGIMGPNTEAAIKKYQEKNNLEATGNLDKETLSSLGVSGDMGGGASAATGGSTSGQASGSTSGQDSGKSEKKQ